MISKFPILLVASLGCYVGCNNSDSRYTAAVQGHVTIDGELAQRGTVNFYPADNGAVATGQIHSDGSYSLRIGVGNIDYPDSGMIAPGNYTATVVVRAAPDPSKPIAEGGPPSAGQKLTSIKYANAETSDLVFEVKSGENIIPLDLEGSSADVNDSVAETDAETKSDDVENPEEKSENNEAASDEAVSKDTPVATGESQEEGAPQ